MNKIVKTVLALVVVAAIYAFGSGVGDSSASSPRGVRYQVYGLNFSPYTKPGQDPNLGTVVSKAQIRAHLKIIAPYTEWIRTFGSTLGLEKAAKIAVKMNFSTAIGAWLDSDRATNEKEMKNLIAAARAGYVDLAIVGSETLYRNELKVNELIDYIERFRQEVPQVPVATAETYQIWLDHPALIDHVDVVLANYYPYWEGIEVQSAMAYVHSRHQRVLAKAGGKEVIVSEAGWPSAGNTIGQAVPSASNAAYYFLNFVSWARAESIDYFYFEAFDEPRKAKYEGPQGAHWGIWDKDGKMKKRMRRVFKSKTMDDNWSGDCTPGGAGTPEIELTDVPPRGSYDNLKGQVWHVDANDHGVAVYIYVSGWWTKPYWSQPVTAIACSGRFTTDITTGGADASATRIAAFLIPFDYDPPLMSGGQNLPPELYNNALDY